MPITLKTGAVKIKDASTESYVDIDMSLGVDYAPINSPVFAGTPQAPTPSLSDSSTKLATTAFVKNLAGIYGVCSTAASTAEKNVTISGITSLITGMTINILFENGNTASNPTININNLGNKHIKFLVNGLTYIDEGANFWYSGVILSFIYDGTYLINKGPYNNIEYQHVDDNDNFLDLVLRKYTINGTYIIGISGTNFTGWPENVIGLAEINVRNGRILIDAKIVNGSRYYNTYNGVRWIGWEQVTTNTILINQIKKTSVNITSTDSKVDTIEAYKCGNVLQLNLTIKANSLSGGFNNISISGLSNIATFSHRISGNVSLGSSSDAGKNIYCRLESPSNVQVFISTANVAVLYLTFIILLD